MSNSKYNALYRDAYNFQMKYYPPHSWNDLEYWDAADDEICAIYNKHQTEFASDLLKAVYAEMERTVKEMYPPDGTGTLPNAQN